MTDHFTGGCFCGAIRYRMQGRPMFIHCCHCTDCQRQTGTAFALNGMIETDRIELLKGEPVVVSLPTDSGRPHDVYRCEACQSSLWSDYGRRPWVRFLRIGTLDNAGAFSPDVQIYTRSKLPWVALPVGSRVFEAYYDMKVEWPTESQERLKAAKAAA